jgi:DHA1 family tetracycline resistance protein-like MFS transporter
MVTVFLSTMGIGIITPIEPFLVQRYVSSPASLAVAVGWLGSSYAICSFIAAPGLESLSDRLGRRPVLLISLLGSALGYLIFGVGGALWVLFLGRIVDGLTGGNVSTIFAYIGDSIEPEQRGRYYGMLGATLGTGFIVGPVIGGVVALLGYTIPLYFAAAITFANLIWGYFFLPESLQKQNRLQRVSLAQLNPVTQLGTVFSLPRFRWLLLTSFLFVLPFAALQATLSLVAKNVLGWNAAAIGVFFLIGGVSIISQGVLLQRLQPKLGDARLMIGGLSFEILGYLVIASIVLWKSVVPIIVGTILFAFGDGFVMPSVGGLLSWAADPREQGRIQGANESVQSLANVIGPFGGGSMYARFGPAIPYLTCALAVVLAMVSLFVGLPTLRPAIVPGDIPYDDNVHEVK